MNEQAIKFYEELKKTRIAKKISLKEISEYTKINNKYLEAIENGDFTILPNVYTRLFLRSYCKYIDVDYNKILDQYEIHTIGYKKKVLPENDLDSLAQKTNTEHKEQKSSENSIDITKDSKDHKEILIAVIAIVFIIILFIIINTIN